MDNSEYTTSVIQCQVCGEILPATSQYFPPYKMRGKTYLKKMCRICWRAKQKAYNDRTRDQDRARRHAWKAANPDKVATQKKRSYERNREHNLARSERWFYANQEHSRELSRNNYYANRTERIQTAMINTVKRMARKKNLPDTFTEKDWDRALDYFDYSCAVCGRMADEYRSIAMDHWIPLTDPNCPGTVPTNIVPLCHGRDGCNNSKGNKDPIQWLNRKFGKEAEAKLTTIAAYFAWIGLQ